MAFVFLIGGLERIREDATDSLGGPGKIMLLLVIYIIGSLPLVQWPGSVIDHGLENFIKAAIFYFFPIWLIDSEEKFKRMMVVFILCQTLRVMEPLYLHVTEGYWGDSTFIGGPEMMNRLRGAPNDPVNANGLAFVIATVIPFYHYLGLGSRNSLVALSYLILLPLLLYTLILTGSRTGMILVGTFFVIAALKSRRKILFACVIILASGFMISKMDPLQEERFQSVYRSDVRGAATAKGRIEGLKGTFEVILMRPIFGFGLGTSLEANFNMMRVNQVAHNLYMEVWQELGIIGLGVYISFLAAILNTFFRVRKKMKDIQGRSEFLVRLGNSMDGWICVNLLGSLASYGLSTYLWYFLGGIVVCMANLQQKCENAASS